LTDLSQEFIAETCFFGPPYVSVTASGMLVMLQNKDQQISYCHCQFYDLQSLWKCIST